MTYRQHSDACHVWTLALLQCAAEGRAMSYLPDLFFAVVNYLH